MLYLILLVSSQNSDLESSIDKTRSYTQFSISSQAVNTGSTTTATISGSGYTFLEILYFSSASPSCRTYTLVPYNVSCGIMLQETTTSFSYLTITYSDSTITITNNSSTVTAYISRISGVKIN